MVSLTAEPPHYPGMDRRRFLLTSLAGALAAPVDAGAQQADKVPRVGVLGAVDGPGWAGFRQGLRELGWGGTEPRRGVPVRRERDERYRELAGELVRLNVDVLAAQNSQFAREAKEATRTIPIVMFSVSYPASAPLIG